jgi:hypothetical protein
MPEKTLKNFEVIGEAMGGRCGEGEPTDRFSNTFAFLIPLNWNMPRF